MRNPKPLLIKHLQKLKMQIIEICLHDILPSILHKKLLLIDLKLRPNCILVLYLDNIGPTVLINGKYLIILAEGISCVPVVLSKVDKINEHVLEVFHWDFLIHLLDVQKILQLPSPFG